MPFFLMVYSHLPCTLIGVKQVAYMHCSCFFFFFILLSSHIPPRCFQDQYWLYNFQVKGFSFFLIYFRMPIAFDFCCFQLTFPLNCVDHMLPVNSFYRFGKWVCYFECFFSFLILPIPLFWEFTILLYFVCWFSSVYLFNFMVSTKTCHWIGYYLSGEGYLCSLLSMKC